METFNLNSHWTVREDLPAKSLEGTEFEKAAIASLTAAQSGKCIVSSLLSSQNMIYPCK